MKAANIDSTAASPAENETVVIGPWTRKRAVVNPRLPRADWPENVEPYRKLPVRQPLHHFDLLLLAVVQSMKGTGFMDAMNVLRELSATTDDPEVKRNVRWAINFACTNDGKQ